ncbi:hypothetical protein VTO73DRAFT_4340 [Trametes versicolor]
MVVGVSTLRRRRAHRASGAVSFEDDLLNPGGGRFVEFVNEQPDSDVYDTPDDSATTAGGTLVNRTIDDQGGDAVTGALPAYLPRPWNEGQTCFGCHLHPGIIEPSQAFNRTWSDTTYSGLGSPAQVVQVGFTGSAVYVYNIVVDSIVADTDTLVNLTFSLDDEAVGAYYHEPISDPPGSVPQVSYHVLVYSNSSLPHGEHALQMVTSGVRAANVLFDYIVYTTEDDPQPPAQPSPITQSPETAAVSSDLPRSTSTHLAPSASDTAQSSSSQHAHTINTAAIAGAVVGGIGLILLVLLSFLIRRRCIRKGRGRIRSPSGLFSRSVRYSNSSYETVAPYNVIALAPSRETRKLALEQHGGTSPSGSPPSNQNIPSVPTADAVGAENERIARLVQQIETLQAQVLELRASQNAVDRRPSDAEQGLSSLLAALRNEVSGLRAELGEQQLVAYPGSILTVSKLILKLSRSDAQTKAQFLRSHITSPPPPPAHDAAHHSSGLPACTQDERITQTMRHMQELQEQTNELRAACGSTYSQLDTSPANAPAQTVNQGPSAMLAALQQDMLGLREGIRSEQQHLRLHLLPELPPPSYLS